MTFQEGFLSEIVGKAAVVVENAAHKTIGRVSDFVVTDPHDTFPKIDSLVVKTKHGSLLAPSETLIDIESKDVVLSNEPTQPAPPEDQALYLVEDLLDKQIVDVEGRKLVRINDIEICRTGPTLRVVAADIGLSGLLRRLGANRLAPPIFDRIPRSLIAWNQVAPIDDLSPTDVRLSVSQKQLPRLHPSDLAEIIGDLSTNDAARVLTHLDDETAADALEHLEPEKQKTIIDEVGTERAADIIEEMDADDAADLLGDLSEEQKSELLAVMEPERAGELRELTSYEEDTAGGLMTTDFMWIYPHRTVAATIDKIRELSPETEFIYYLYVLDQSEKLLGVLSLRELLLAKPTDTIHGIMATDIVHVDVNMSSHDVAGTIARYDLLACPVVDDKGVMLGIVTVDDAIDAILPEKLKRQLPRFTRRHKHQERSGAA
ncbi:MAG: magnesium transporter [Candidatus Eremiobacteraeota bacterium]|nr:magnesium transporter [Candidatus Eremiobacteraeota bacterium]